MMDWFQSLLPTILVFVHVAVTSNTKTRMQFYGGSLSYTLKETHDGKYIVEIELISGWVLGKGPCGPNCTSADVGRPTKSSRQYMLHDDPSWFGVFRAEHQLQNGSTAVTEINDIVTKNYTARVLALSESAKWEQEHFKSSIPLLYDGKFDISYEGHSWTTLRIQEEKINRTDLYWHFQAKISTKLRSDTGKPNQCPRGFAKAFYRVKLDEVSTIQIQVADQDDDIIKCRIAMFVEGGELSTFYPPNVNVFENCTVRINASTSAGYRNEDRIGIPVIVEDFTKTNIQYGSDDHSAVKFVLCPTSVQFTVSVLENLKTPVFIAPTAEENHLFIVYANSRWETTLYALPAPKTTLDEYVVFGLNEEVFRHSVMYNDTEEGGKHFTVSWTPNATDIGLHFSCIRVVDNKGFDVDRCFKLEVRPDVFNFSYVQLVGRPYFVDIPSSNEYVNCELAATCLVPLYVHSSNPLKFIHITESFTDTAALGQIDRESRNGEIVSTTTLLFSNSAVGRPKICLMASDINGLQSEQVCLNAEILPLDPCLSAPCVNSATCRSDRNRGTFICQCLNGFNGKFCDIINDNPCEPQPGPCIRENTKACFYVKPYPAYCNCITGFAGNRCEINKNDCRKDTCNLRGICKDLVNNTSCVCYQRYSGARCTIDACPTVSNTSLTCPSVLVECVNNPCSGKGVCSSGGECVCSIGTSGFDCSTAHGFLQVQGSVEFIPPTPKRGGSIICYTNSSHGFDCRILVAIATRSGLKPTLETISPGNLTIIQGAMEKIHAFREVNNVFSCALSITGTSMESQGLYICMSARISGSEDNVCLEINIKSDPYLVRQSFEYSQKNALIKFVDPTPVGGSSLLAYRGEKFTLLLFTLLVSSCQNVYSPSTGLTVFPATVAGSVCSTEATFTFNNTGNKDICFQSALSDFQQLCYRVTVIEKSSDYCVQSPCQNGGHCFLKEENGVNYHCICEEEYIGRNCQKGPCPINDCSNGAYCEVNDGNKTCVCKAGYFGPKCADSHAMTGSELQIYSAARPKSFQCVIFQPCNIALLVTGFITAGQRIFVEPGYVSSGIQVDDIELTHIGTTTDTYQANIRLMPGRNGLQDVCIQAKNQQGVNKDEICFQVDVIKDVSSVYGFQDRPHFVYPSLPLNASVECGVGEPCHVIYTYIPGNDSNGTCVSIRPKVSDIQTYKIYTNCDQCINGTSKYNNCTVDVSIASTTSDIGNDKIFCLELQGSSAKGEERCFNLSVVTTSSFNAKTGCQTVQCQNGGFCDGHIPSSPMCYCKKGFSGIQCENSQVKVASSSHTKSQILFGDMAIPSLIECRLNQTCFVPLQIMASATLAPTASLGYVDPRIIVGEPVIRITDVSGVFVGSSDVDTTREGTFKACFQTIENSTIVDELCLAIHVKDVSESPPDATKPFFLSPTLSKDSTVICIVGQMCHLEMHYSYGDNSNASGQCPSLSDRSVPLLTGIHIFRPEKHGNYCTSYVAYLPKTANDNTLFCVQVGLPGKKGENRCYRIRAVTDLSKEVQSPCTGFVCHHGGKCVANLTANPANANCICALGFEGNNCQTGKFPSCHPNMCINGGQCLNGTCNCPVGYSGEHCEQVSDPCKPSPCVRGVCFHHQTQFRCLCPSGYTGKRCELDIDECSSDPCMNGGFCKDGIDQFACQCRTGFDGYLCQNVADPCVQNPCVRGTCFSHDSDFLCDCPEHYIGKFCEKSAVTNLRVQSGMQFTLNCSVSDAQHQQTFQWSKLNSCGGPIENNTVSIYHRQNVNIGDSGTYICSTRTIAGVVTQTFHVDIMARSDVDSCNFDDGGTCNWVQHNNDNFDWTLQSGSTLTADTGPDNDHTLGTSQGKYLYVESSSPRQAGEFASLVSPLLPANHTLCFEFWYYMYGDGIGKLQLHLQDTCLHQEKELFKVEGDHGMRWMKASISINALQATNDYKLVITADVGPTYKGDTAIDDLSVSDGECKGGIGGPQIIG